MGGQVFPATVWEPGRKRPGNELFGRHIRTYYRRSRNVLHSLWPGTGRLCPLLFRLRQAHPGDVARSQHKLEPAATRKADCGSLRGCCASPRGRRHPCSYRMGAADDIARGSGNHSLCDFLDRDAEGPSAPHQRRQPNRFRRGAGSRLAPNRYCAGRRKFH